MTPEDGASRPRPEPTPRSIAHYVVKGRLGKGAMGIVYRALDERTRQEVALKVMVSDLEGDPETRARFFREAQIAGQLRHRNVVWVFDSGEDAGRLFIAMELLTGCTLTEFMRGDDAPDLESRIDLMIQVCQGLMVAHDAGIYHRDIKPANLFVCEDRRLKILDFGVARLANSSMTLTGHILGTPDFMSPEQARGADVDERSDIFSAAAVFYLMLTGRKPFAAADLPAVLNKVLRVDPDPLREDEAPEALAAVVKKALSKDPTRRQQNAAQLIDELMAAEAAITRANRHVAAAARPLAEEMARLSSQCRDLRTSLELVDGGDAWRALIARYPALQRGPLALTAFPLRRSVTADITGQLKSHIAPLREQVAALQQAHRAWTEGRERIAAGQFDAASTTLSAAARLVPGSPAVARDIEACARARAQRDERNTLVQARIASAAEAAARQDWQGVLTIAASLDEINAGHPDVEHLRTQAARMLALERERQMRDQRAAIEGAQRVADAARLVVEAERKLDAMDLTAAERCAAQALSLNGEDAAARELLDRIRAAIRVQQSRTDTMRRVSDLLEQARRLAEQKQYSKALASVDAALTWDAGNARAVALRAEIDARRVAFEVTPEQQPQAAATRACQSAPAVPVSLPDPPPLPETAANIVPDDKETVAIPLPAPQEPDASADLRGRASSFLKRFQKGPR